MKRSKYEHMQATVGQYLKRRQFYEGDSSHKKENRWTHPMQGMALKGSVTGEATLDNTLSFSSISGDATMCEQQYSRLKTFIMDAGDEDEVQLQKLLYCVFVHIYIELLNNGHKAPAHKFFSRHSPMFQDDDKIVSLKVLSKLNNKEEIGTVKEVQDFRDMKYPINLSSNAFIKLNKHLEIDDNMIMMKIFNQHIKLQVKTETTNNFRLKEEKAVDDQQPVSPACIPDNKVVHDDQALSSLKQCIREVREGPPCVSSILFYTFLNAYQGLCCASTSPDNEMLAAGFEDHSSQIWKLTPGLFPPRMSVEEDPSLIHLSADYLQGSPGDDEESLPSSVSDKEQEFLSLKGHTGVVYQTKFISDSNFLLTCSEDSTVRLWDIKTQTNAAVYRGHNYPVWDLDTSVVGDYFVSCSHDQTAKLWCTERIYPLRSFIGHTYDVDCVRFHPNSNYVATGSGDKTVRLWSTQEGKSVRLLQGHKASVLALAFSPNGKLLASSGEDRRIRVWDLGTGSLFKEYRGHTDTVYSLSFNNDSTLLASGGLDCCIRVWDLRHTPSSSSLSSPQAEGPSSPEMLAAFPTKSIPVCYLNYTRHNLLQAAGAI